MSDCNVVCMLTSPVADCPGEGFGFVTAEAMAVGVPVLATDCGASPEIIKDGISGILVPINDAGAAARALEAILRNPESLEKMGKAAQASIKTSFDIDLTAKTLARLYYHLHTRSGEQVCECFAQQAAGGSEPC